MDKFAKGDRDRRIGFFNELNEDYGPGKLVEKYHETFTGKEGEFAELMNTLREVDGNVREIAAPLKNTIKAARSSFNRREYIATISYLGQYHDALESIMNEFSKLNTAVDLKHNEFLFNGVDEEALNYFKEKLPLKFKPKDQTKIASLSDWWSNLTSDKGRALKAWEKRFPKYAKKFKGDTEKLLLRAETLQNTFSLSLKGLASLRASRKLEEYLNVVTSLTSKYKDFNNIFDKYYQEHVNKFLEQQKDFNSDTEVKNKEIGVKKNEEPSLEKGTDSADLFKDQNKPEVKPNAPAPFPNDEDEDNRDPDWATPRSGIPASYHPISVPESVRETIEDEDILPTSSTPPHGRGSLIQDLLHKKVNDDIVADIVPSKKVLNRELDFSQEDPKPPVKNVVRHDTMPSVGNDQVNDKIDTDKIPGMVNVKEPFDLVQSGIPTLVPPSDIIHVKEAPHGTPTVIPSGNATPHQTNQNSQSFRKSIAPIPQSNRITLEQNDQELDSVPIPPVKETILPKNNNSVMPAIPPAALVPGSSAAKNKGNSIIVKKENVQEFLEGLNKFSNESPFVLANEIIKFANTLDNRDTSEKLFKIAKNLLK